MVRQIRLHVLAANDGIASTTSVLTGVAAANRSSQSIFLASVAGLVRSKISCAKPVFSAGMSSRAALSE
ncbi:VIT1/CCC1 transporter family protein [Klebsiella pneumoniae]|nr:VIT1/CCC1 transporter family protein [Klebsiella pneumoniae]